MSGIGTWNHRIIEHRNELAAPSEQIYYEMHEVHYNEDSSLRGYTNVRVTGNSEVELKEYFAMMAQAFAAPILNETDFGGDCFKPAEYIK